MMLFLFNILFYSNASIDERSSIDPLRDGITRL